jgi:hypothetical protein
VDISERFLHVVAEEGRERCLSAGTVRMGSSRGASISKPQAPQLCSPTPSTSSEGMYMVVGSSHIRQRMVISDRVVRR